MKRWPAVDEGRVQVALLVLTCPFSSSCRRATRAADSIMLADICRFFRLKAYVEQEVTVCLVLYKSGAVPQSRMPEGLDISHNGLSLQMQHDSIKALQPFLDKERLAAGH